jgi:hypothetical protein
MLNLAEESVIGTLPSKVRFPSKKVVVSVIAFE